MPRKPGEKLCAARALSSHKAYNKSRPTRHKFYNSQEWRRCRDWFYKHHPLCAECEKQGIVKIGQIVDHIISIEDGGAKTDTENLQTLCQSCHNKKTFGTVK